MATFDRAAADEYLAASEKYPLRLPPAACLRAALAEIDRLSAELRDYTTAAESDRIAATNAGWQLAHDPRECGHPRACYQDRNWPASHLNYDPETRTSDPPMEYRCLMCEQEAENARLSARVADLEGQVHECPTCGRACKECGCVEAELAYHRKQADEIVHMSGCVRCATDAECDGCGCRQLSAGECAALVVIDRDALRVKYARLREALKPFAAIATGAEKDGHTHWTDGEGLCFVSAP